MATAEVEERQLLKAMTWWDGFVVALANPGFLIAALGASIGVLGTTGAFVLWTVSVLIGALQNNVYAEMATMFPQKAGGISLYAHEAWRKYLSFVGPVATFGYWFAWSSVLAINGYVIGTLAQAEWSENTTFTQDVGNFQWSLPVWIGIGCIIAVWLFNVYGVRPAVWLAYATGGLLILPAAVLMFLPYLTGDWSSDNMTWAIGTGGGLGLALTWLYFMGWSAYGFETVAAFAPVEAWEDRGMSDFPESHRFLLDRPLATLATIGADGRPQLSEIVFLFDEDELRISLNNSRQKSKNLIANPKVTLMILDDSGYKYLEVRGDAKVEPDDDYAFGEKLMAKYPGLDLRALDGPGEKRLKVTIEPTRIREVDMTGGGD